MIGRQNSTLSKNIDILLVTSVKQEACTLDLAPTASTTATLDLLIHTGDNILFVYADTSVRDALLTISDRGLDVTGVLNHDDELVGVITDSDIRRGLEKGGNNIFNKTAEFMMSKNTKWVLINTLAIFRTGVDGKAQHHQPFRTLRPRDEKTGWDHSHT